MKLTILITAIFTSFSFNCLSNNQLNNIYSQHHDSIYSYFTILEGNNIKESHYTLYKVTPNGLNTIVKINHEGNDYYSPDLGGSILLCGTFNTAGRNDLKIHCIKGDKIYFSYFLPRQGKLTLNSQVRKSNESKKNLLALYSYDITNDDLREITSIPVIRGYFSNISINDTTGIIGYNITPKIVPKNSGPCKYRPYSEAYLYSFRLNNLTTKSKTKIIDDGQYISIKVLNKKTYYTDKNKNSYALDNISGTKIKLEVSTFNNVLETDNFFYIIKRGNIIKYDYNGTKLIDKALYAGNIYSSYSENNNLRLGLHVRDDISSQFLQYLVNNYNFDPKFSLLFIELDENLQDQKVFQFLLSQKGLGNSILNPYGILNGSSEIFMFFVAENLRHEQAQNSSHYDEFLYGKIAYTSSIPHN